MRLFSCLIGEAQRMNSDKIYWVALDKYTANLQDKDHRVIYIEKPDFIDSIPPIINGHQLVFITPDNQLKLYRQNHNKLIHTKISPVTIEDSLVRVSIVPYFGELKYRHHYNLGVSTGCSIYFKFDVSKKEFVFDKVTKWGI